VRRDFWRPQKIRKKESTKKDESLTEIFAQKKTEKKKKNQKNTGAHCD